MLRYHIVVYLDVNVPSFARTIHLTKIQALFVMVLGRILVTGLDQLLEIGEIVFVVCFGDEDYLVQNPSIFDEVSLQRSGSAIGNLAGSSEMCTLR